MIDIMKNQIIGPAIQEGLDRGRIEGREMAYRKILRRQLSKRFGKLPPDAVRKLEGASVETLELWVDQLLTAPSLEEVFRVS